MFFTYINSNLKKPDDSGILFDWFYFTHELEGKDKPGYADIEKSADPILLGAAAIFGLTLMIQQDTKPAVQAGDPASSVLNRVEYGDRG